VKGKKMFKKLMFFSLIILFPLVGFTQNAKENTKEKERFQKLDQFNKILFLIENNYYRDIDFNKLIDGALKGMMSTLDPHSMYLGKENFEKMEEETEGEFGGLGIEVTQKDGVMVVITPMDDSPAYEAGIKTGDKIIEINNENVVGLSLEEAVKKMRGKANSKITVGILRDGQEKSIRITMVRRIIKVKPVKAEIIQDNFGYLRLVQFQKKSYNAIVEAIEKFNKDLVKKGGLNGLIFDLRANPGGLLEEAIDISSIFLHDGIVVSIESRDPKNKDIRFVKKTGFKDLTTPLVVLIDGSSASASEIVAGALRDHNRAILMGTRTFGKGSVQTVSKIDEEAGLKLTIAQYMTPSGKKIQALGINPDVELNVLTDNYSKLSKEVSYIREADLKGHLDAVVESEEEKKLRIEQQKKVAEDSMKKMNKIKNKDEKLYDPMDDYQVIQALNYLKANKIFKKIKL
jgi:carboxyl-terminal processing protease